MLTQSMRVVKEFRVTNLGNEIITFHENENWFSSFTRKNMVKKIMFNEIPFANLIKIALSAFRDIFRLVGDPTL